MDEQIRSLTREFLAWVSTRPRSYSETMEAWRTNCPRHSVWEDTLIAGLIRIDRDQKVILTPRALALLGKDCNEEVSVASLYI